MDSSSPLTLSMLVLEDSDLCYGLTQRYIERVGKTTPGLIVTVKRTLNLSETLELLDHERFDVIFADLNVGDSFGMATAARLAAHSSKTPIVIISGVNEDEVDKDKLIEMNIVDFLDKTRVYASGYEAAHNAIRFLLLAASRGFKEVQKQ